MKNNTALNIYLLSVLLVEQIDETEGQSYFKQKFKYHAKGLIKEIENFDQNVLNLTEAEEMHKLINEKREILL